MAEVVEVGEDLVCKVCGRNFTVFVGPMSDDEWICTTCLLGDDDEELEDDDQDDQDVEELDPAAA